MATYTVNKQQSTEEESVLYAIFVQRDPTRFTHSKATLWFDARETGARLLRKPRERLNSEDVWAVVICAGETVEQAVKRGVQILKERGELCRKLKERK